jgi:hypothetical protein
MATIGTIASQTLPLTQIGRVVFDVLGRVVTSVQVMLLEGSLGSVAINVYRSDNGVKFYALESTVTQSTEGITAALSATGFAFLAVEVTTVSGSAAYAEVTVVTKGDA